MDKKEIDNYRQFGSRKRNGKIINADKKKTKTEIRTDTKGKKKKQKEKKKKKKKKKEKKKKKKKVRKQIQRKSKIEHETVAYLSQKCGGKFKIYSQLSRRNTAVGSSTWF